MFLIVMGNSKNWWQRRKRKRKGTQWPNPCSVHQRTDTIDISHILFFFLIDVSFAFNSNQGELAMELPSTGFDKQSNGDRRRTIAWESCLLGLISVLSIPSCSHLLQVWNSSSQFPSSLSLQFCVTASTLLQSLDRCFLFPSYFSL